MSGSKLRISLVNGSLEEKSVTTLLSDDDALAGTLLSQLAERFNRSAGKFFGSMVAPEENQESAALLPPLKALLNDVNDEDKWSSFIKSWLEILAGHFTDLALCWIEDKTESEHYAWIACLPVLPTVRVMDGQLDCAESLSAEHSEWIVRVDLLQLEQDEAGRCLGLLAGKPGSQLSRLSKEQLGLASALSSSVMTRQVMDALELSVSSGEEPEQRQKQRKELLTFCEEKTEGGEPLALDDLVALMEPSQQVTFKQQVEHLPEEVAEPSRRQFKRLARLSGQDKGVSIGFDTDLLGSRIVYDAATDKLTIQGLPDQLRERLQRL